MTYQTMDVCPFAGSLGAEIYGVDLKDRDDSPIWQELRQAFLDCHMIAVRGQDMSPTDLMRVGGKVRRTRVPPVRLRHGRVSVRDADRRGK